MVFHSSLTNSVLFGGALVVLGFKLAIAANFSTAVSIGIACVFAAASYSLCCCILFKLINMFHITTARNSR